MHPGIRCKSRKTKKKNFLKLPLHIKEKTKKKYNFFFLGGGVIARGIDIGTSESDSAVSITQRRFLFIYTVTSQGK